MEICVLSVIRTATSEAVSITLRFVYCSDMGAQIFLLFNKFG